MQINKDFLLKIKNNRRYWGLNTGKANISTDENFMEPITWVKRLWLASAE